MVIKTQIRPSLATGIVELPDDASVSSTLTVERLNNTKGLHLLTDADTSTAKKVVPKKNVTFGLDCNVQYDTEYISCEEYRERWYTGKDYKEFKSCAKDAAAQITRLESRNRAPYSYQRVMEKTFAICIHTTHDHDEYGSESSNSKVIPESHFVHLLRWVEVATSRCGLEKWSLQHISRDRSTRRKLLTGTVLTMQNSYKNKSGESVVTADAATAVSSNETSLAEQIRLCSENISRPSRMFARVLGQALAEAEQKASSTSSKGGKNEQQ